MHIKLYRPHYPYPPVFHSAPKFKLFNHGVFLFIVAHSTLQFPRPHTHHQNRPPHHTLCPEQDHRVYHRFALWWPLLCPLSLRIHREPQSCYLEHDYSGSFLSSKPIEAMEFYLRMILRERSWILMRSLFLWSLEQNMWRTMKGNRSMDIFWSLDLAPMPLDLKWIMHVYKNLLRDAVSFTALISGYVSRGSMDDARFLFDYLWEMWCLGTPWFRATLKAAGLKRHWLNLFVEMLKAYLAQWEYYGYGAFCLRSIGISRVGQMGCVFDWGSWTWFKSSPRQCTY